jgi:hypothetical protein
MNRYVLLVFLMLAPGGHMNQAGAQPPKNETSTFVAGFGEFAIRSKTSRARLRSIHVSSASNWINRVRRHSPRSRSGI